MRFSKLVCVALFLSISSLGLAAKQTVVENSDSLIDGSPLLIKTTLGLLLGVPSLEVSVPLSPQSTIGGYISGSTLAQTAGITGRWYKKGIFTDSFYIAPFTQISSATIPNIRNNTYSTKKTTAKSFSIILGHQWMWDSSFHINFGLGIAHHSLSDKIELGEHSGLHIPQSGLLPTGELTFGLVI